MPRAQAKHSKKAITCSKCGRAFFRNFDLKRHALIHSTNKDELKRKCTFDDCTYSTLQKSNLATHISAVHLKLKPHKCSIEECSSSFADSASLIRHQKNIHGVFRKARKSAVNARRNGELELSVPAIEIIDLTEDDDELSPTPSLCAYSSSSEFFPSTPSSPGFMSTDSCVLGRSNPLTYSLCGTSSTFGDMPLAFDHTDFPPELPQNVGVPFNLEMFPTAFDMTADINTDLPSYPTNLDLSFVPSVNFGADTEFHFDPINCSSLPCQGFPGFEHSFNSQEQDLLELSAFDTLLYGSSLNYGMTNNAQLL